MLLIDSPRSTHTHTHIHIVTGTHLYTLRTHATHWKQEVLTGHKFADVLRMKLPLVALGFSLPPFFYFLLFFFVEAAGTCGFIVGIV